MIGDEFSDLARELITAKMMESPDEGVRTITATFGVPDDAVEQVAAKLRAKAASERTEG